ncbi:MAG: DUF3021 domain-containing protein [Acutalibacteraceae bacterium]|jgi:hypothetical protein
MKKLFIKRSLIGMAAGAAAVHIFTLLVNKLSRGEWLLCMPELTEKIGFPGAAVLQTFLACIIGIIGFGGMCLFDIESWSLLRSTVVHGASILFAYLTVGLTLHWFSFHIIPILIITAITVVVYALIWLFMYIGWKKKIREMNVLTEEYKKDITK